MSFIQDKIQFDGLTFDDVLLLPAYSEILPREVTLGTRFTRNIRLNAPFVSAAMDTVTEAKMAIAMAREGGIGVIHKNMPIAEQSHQVSMVKRAQNGMINNPVTITPDKTVGDAQRIMREYRIGGIPVINEKGVLVGIVTNRDLRFETKMARPITEVMTTENLITTTHYDDMNEVIELLQRYKIEKLPVVDDQYRLVGLITYSDITNSKDKPNASKDASGRLLVAAGVGISHETLARVEALVEAGVDALVLDSAHGNSAGVINALKEVKRNFSTVDVVVGNIATPDAARRLVDAGADAVKVGIGPGSICTTRVVAGVGVPQLSAIYGVSKELKGTDVPLIADGGLRYSGDIVKALAAGGDTVMLGGMLAGVEEAPGATILYNGRKYKTYRGMGSLEAMQCGSKDRYMQSDVEDAKKLVPEGISGRVPYKGTLYEVFYQMAGGLRSGMGYCGAATIEKLHEARFCRISAAGVVENHPHDITITSESPNYSKEL
ncbi:MAG: IMP dehydrogenase [Bacteroidales bacterium]|nr:IMP dehydrogenase [Bacteroidales bacterium]